jgi:hypothetical protein
MQEDYDDDFENEFEADSPVGGYQPTNSKSLKAQKDPGYEPSNNLNRIQQMEQNKEDFTSRNNQAAIDSSPQKSSYTKPNLMANRTGRSTK